LNIYNRYRREAIALKTIYPQERFGLWDFFRLLFLNSLSDCYSAILDRSFWRNITGILTFRLMQFWGTYMGYVHKAEVSRRLREKFYYPNGLKRPGFMESEPDSKRLIEYGNIPAGEKVDKNH